jgi:hypothetical protein
LRERFGKGVQANVGVGAGFTSIRGSGFGNTRNISREFECDYGNRPGAQGLVTTFKGGRACGLVHIPRRGTRYTSEGAPAGVGRD